MLFAVVTASVEKNPLFPCYHHRAIQSRRSAADTDLCGAIAPEDEQMALRDTGLQDILLQLPSSLRDRAEEMASRERLSLNLFVATAVAEKLQRLQMEACLGITEREDFPLSSPHDALTLVH